MDEEIEAFVRLHRETAAKRKALVMARDAEAARLVAAGHPASKIADAIGVKRQRVSQMVANASEARAAP